MWPAEVLGALMSVVLLPGSASAVHQYQAKLSIRDCGFQLGDVHKSPVVLQQLLKRVINEQRPPNARAADPGMPSSHATILSFLATYVAAALALQPSAAALHQALSSAFLAAAAFLVCSFVPRSAWRVVLVHGADPGDMTPHHFG